MLARRRAYDDQHITMAHAARAVCYSQLRPQPPRRWPAALSGLLRECWAHKPDDRPEFEAIVRRLEELVASTAEGDELLDALQHKACGGCCVVQ